MRTLVCVLAITLLSNCQDELSVRSSSDATSTEQPTQPDPCAGQTSPSPQCPENSKDKEDNEDKGDNEDERCSKECDDICGSWGKAQQFSRYEGDVSTCSNNSYTLTRTGKRYRTCPDITCGDTKKECPTTEDVTETKEKECRCPTVTNGKSCSVVSVCAERSCQDGGQRCRQGRGPCIRYEEKEVCTKIDNGVQAPCYDW